MRVASHVSDILDTLGISRPLLRPMPRHPHTTGLSLPRLRAVHRQPEPKQPHAEDAAESEEREGDPVLT